MTEQGSFYDAINVKEIEKQFDLDDHGVVEWIIWAIYLFDMQKNRQFYEICSSG